MPGLRSQSDLDRDIWEDAFSGHMIHWGWRCGADIAARNVSGLCKPCHIKRQRKGG